VSAGHHVFLGLGTNLGDRLGFLQAAVEMLPPQVRVRRLSPVYETPPWGYLDQPAFLNQVLEGETALEPLALLDYLKQCEAAVGRVKSFQYGPRQIDLDILFYDDLTLDDPLLTIPHPLIAQRAFVLAPLADLAPELCHPRSGRTVAAMLAEIGRDGVAPYQPAGG